MLNLVDKKLVIAKKIPAILASMCLNRKYVRVDMHYFKMSGYDDFDDPR